MGEFTRQTAHVVAGCSQSLAPFTDERIVAITWAVIPEGNAIGRGHENDDTVLTPSVVGLAIIPIVVNERFAIRPDELFLSLTVIETDPGVIQTGSAKLAIQIAVLSVITDRSQAEACAVAKLPRGLPRPRISTNEIDTLCPSDRWAWADAAFVDLSITVIVLTAAGLLRRYAPVTFIAESLIDVSVAIVI